MGAHSHSGLLGQGPASWPIPVAIGQPTTHRTGPERGQRTRRGAVVGYRRQGLHLDHPHSSSY
jgi:hypothetical protein